MVKKYILLFLLPLLCSTTFAQRLVLPGDHPDPSVVKIGDGYWATATTSNWGPLFPLYYSKDLLNWERKSFVFNQLPQWADYYFWAPEISYENGKVYIYYTAHKKDGNLSVGVATASNPEGPYTDLGPLVGQKDGSIDGFSMRDENGKLYLIWKEDGNSVGQPTPIWAMEMSEDRTALIGEKKELFRNQETWEANLVEGVSIVKQGKYFYAFYAAGACCGIDCDYKTGVARSTTLLGPWEKYDKNPILQSGPIWKCPGHGTAVEKDGRFYFLYHAYNREGNIFTGREGLVQEFKFTSDQWVEFIPDQPSNTLKVTQQAVIPLGDSTQNNWEWIVFKKPHWTTNSSKIRLSALPGKQGAVIARKVVASHYTTTVKFNSTQSTAPGGIICVGDENNSLSCVASKTRIRVEMLKGGALTFPATIKLPPLSKLRQQKGITLKMIARSKNTFDFYYSINGKTYTKVNPRPIDGTYLPTWDRAPRVGLVAKGPLSAQTVFSDFILRSSDQ